MKELRIGDELEFTSLGDMYDVILLDRGDIFARNNERELYNRYLHYSFPDHASPVIVKSLGTHLDEKVVFLEQNAYTFVALACNDVFRYYISDDWRKQYAKYLHEKRLNV